MRHFVLFKTILVALLAVNANATPSIGSVTELEGSAAVFRKELRNEADLDFGIESYDDVRTAQGRIALQFLDDSVLKLTEQSSIIIDEFVYDANPSKSKLALSFASGMIFNCRLSVMGAVVQAFKTNPQHPQPIYVKNFLLFILNNIDIILINNESK